MINEGYQRLDAERTEDKKKWQTYQRKKKEGRKVSKAASSRKALIKKLLEVEPLQLFSTHAKTPENQ